MCISENIPKKTFLEKKSHRTPITEIRYPPFDKGMTHSQAIFWVGEEFGIIAITPTSSKWQHLLYYYLFFIKHVTPQTQVVA